MKREDYGVLLIRIVLFTMREMRGEISGYKIEREREREKMMRNLNIHTLNSKIHTHTNCNG